MIDIHTHILPGIDDGAKNIDESLKLIELLHEQGVAGAVCTPHYYPYLMDINEFVNRRKEALNLIFESKIQLYSASETYLHEYLFHNSNLDFLTVENTDYLLLELPYIKKWDKNIFETIERLTIHFCIIPIIAHIERYPAAGKRDIKRLKEIGCIMQLNVSSLLDKRIKRRALSLIRTGLIDVLGSDCHDIKTRPPRIKTALDVIGSKIGNQYCDRLIRNSSMIVKGIDIR